MIHTRVLVGSILAIAAAGVLVGDSYLAPWYPCLFVCLLIAGALAGRELVRLIPFAYRPSEPLTIVGIDLCLAANWFPTLCQAMQTGPGTSTITPVSPFNSILFVFIATLLAAFILEMVRFQQPGHGIPRIGSTLLAVAYLGVLPCCFAQIRFLSESGLLLALVIFVPKCNDIAAFFAGTFLGRHQMTPLLSPKKTWEGFIGGMVGSALAGVILASATEAGAPPLFRGGLWEAAAFGIVVGLAGVLGDLAESLIKRDCHSKDASRAIPGFGGLLDVVDSVLFAAPVAYVWFAWRS